MNRATGLCLAETVHFGSLRRRAITLTMWIRKAAIRLQEPAGCNSETQRNQVRGSYLRFRRLRTAVLAVAPIPPRRRTMAAVCGERRRRTQRPVVRWPTCCWQNWSG